MISSRVRCMRRLSGTALAGPLLPGWPHSRRPFRRWRRDMDRRSLTFRVETLEKTVEGLQALPAQVGALAAQVASLEGQFLQLRAEMQSEFSAIREELRAES